MRNFIPELKLGLINIGVLALVILSGCNQNQESAIIKKFTPPEDETIATNYIAQLRQNKFDLIEKDIDPSLKDALTQDTLTKMAKAIPSEDPVSVKVTGAYQMRDADRYRINLTFEYQFGSKWMLINVATQKKGAIRTIIGFNVQSLSASLENLNKFTLAGKTFLQYATLAFAVLIPFFTLYALVLCFRTKMEKKKWLWIIFVLIGIGKFTVNWTTNEWSFAPLYFQFLGSGCFAPPYGAWLISVSLPMGAIVFLVRRKTLGAPVASGSSTPV